MTNSTRYLKHRGKPLVGIWGLGFNGGLAVTPSAGQSILNYFRTAGCTVIGGVPANWRTLNGDSQTDAGWASVYRSFDVLCPWTVGRYTTDAQADSYKTSTLVPDLAECQANGIDYFPVVFPGYSAHNLGGTALNSIPRNGGRFFWRQNYNALSAGATMVFGAMFDEIDEGTALYKLAPTLNETPAAAPTDPYQFFALNADGYTLPSDWYLQVTAQGTLALHQTNPLSQTLPITPTNAILVTAPNGGINWTAGAPATVTWSTTGTVGNVNIDLSTDGGAFFRALVYNAPNTGSRAITIPFYASTNCRIRVAATNGTPVDWSDSAFTIKVAGANTNVDLQSLWSLSPGSRTYLPNDGNNTARGLAYNPTADEVYLINTSQLAVNVLDGATGTNEGTLNTTGVSGGNFTLDKIGVAADGVIYAGNVQTSVSGSAPFKLYRWASSAGTAPITAYSGAAGFANGLRVGDLFAVRGAGTNTQVLVGARLTSTVCLLTTANGTNFTAHTITTDTSATQLGGALAFGLGNSFWAVTNGLTPARLNFDPVSFVATTAQAFSASTFPPRVGPFSLDPANSLLAAVVLADGADQLNLYDLLNPTSAPELLSSWSIPGSNDNNYGLGAVAFGGNRLYALDTNNGLLAFRILFPGGATKLAATRNSAGLLLSWPATARGFSPEKRTSLATTSVWQSVLDPIYPAGNNNVVTQSMPSAGGFYRLRQP